MPEPSLNLYDLIQSGGVVGVCAFIVIAFMKGWLFTKGAMEREWARTEEWKSIALGVLPLGETLADALRRRDR